MTIFLHRSSGITTPQAMWLIAFGISLLLGSLVFGLKAASDLWEKGYKGGRATVNGFVLSILLLIPFGIQLSKALENPQLQDVSTDVFNLPVFLEPAKNVGEGEGPIDAYDEYSAQLIVSNYPELVTRRYSAPQERVAGAVTELLKRWNWRIRASENLPEEEAGKEPDQEAAKTAEDEAKLAGNEQEVKELTEQNIPENLPDVIIQAEAKSFLMKLPSYIVVRVSSESDTTIVDMRSASYWGRHDFGSNASNISQFLAALDQSLAGVAGE